MDMQTVVAPGFEGDRMFVSGRGRLCGGGDTSMIRDGKAVQRMIRTYSDGFDSLRLERRWDSRSK